MARNTTFRTCVAVFCIVPIAAAAQSITFVTLERACDYLGIMRSKRVATFASSAEAEIVIQRIVDAAGIAKNFRISAAGVPNAAAMTTREGERIIYYNPSFIHDLTERTGSQWAPISVMAHEVGHHLNGHTITLGAGSLSMELEADLFSGFILQRLGASAKDATIAMETIGNAEASATHPGKLDRIAAIASGWQKACEMDSVCKEQSILGTSMAKRTPTTPPPGSALPASVPAFAREPERPSGSEPQKDSLQASSGGPESEADTCNETSTCVPVREGRGGLILDALRQ